MPRLRANQPTLNLEQVELLAQSQNPAHEYFHFFGIFKKEAQYAYGTCWTLFDEFKEINVKLNGDLATYIRPKSGDIIRVHRAKVNTLTKMAEVQVSKNVVIWPAFDEDPAPKTSAKQASIDQNDTDRCSELQIYYTSQITRICEISKQLGTGTSFLTLAGRLDDRIMDSFGHLEIKFSDGTGEYQMRIFAKMTPVEDDVHFKTARDLKKGDYFIANNVKYDRATKKIQLSANTLYGRSLRLVAKRSVLGIILSTSLKVGVDQENNQANERQVNLDDDRPADGSQSNSHVIAGRRRSPRLLSQQQHQEDSSNSQNSVVTVASQNSSTASQRAATSASQENPSKKPHLDSDVRTRAQQPLQTRSDTPAANLSVDLNRQQLTTDESLPSYKKYADIKPKEVGYDFFDIVGQVRAEPVLTAGYNNCILQIYDGSRHDHSSFYSFEVDRVMPGCVLVQIYSKQKETDTDEHIEKAKRLKEGELILLKNVKTSFRGGKLKLELSANKSHDKSINVIDKDSLFGVKLLDVIENPIVEGLDEQIDPNSSNNSRYTQDTDNFLMDIS